MKVENNEGSIASEFVRLTHEVKKWGIAPLVDLLEDGLTKEEMETLIKILASRKEG